MHDPRFAAALLAGGRSRRMGRDKAFLAWEGRLLWEHQMEKLRSLEPSALLLSGRREQPFPLPPGIPLVEDFQPDAGPLGGVGSCLAVCPAPLLVVLGIDLPFLPARFLRNLLDACTPARGAVVRSEGGAYYEPLAAVYPVIMRDLARDHLAEGKLSMQALIRRGLTEGLLREVEIQVEPGWFTNVNAPDDLPPSP